MGYQYGRTVTREQIITEYERAQARQRAYERGVARGRKAAEAAERVKELIGEVEALRIPPNPNGVRNRIVLERELTEYHRRRA